MIANSRRRAYCSARNRRSPRISDLNYLYTSSSGLEIDLDPFPEETVTEFKSSRKIMDKAVAQVFKEQMEKEHLEMLPLPDLSGEKHVRVSELTPAAQPTKTSFPNSAQIWEPVRPLDQGKTRKLYYKLPAWNLF